MLARAPLRCVRALLPARPLRFAHCRCSASGSMAGPPRRGAFILFEGIDRSGKTTQCTKLVEHLVTALKMDAELMRFPVRTSPLGKMIDAYLKSSTDLDPNAVHLMFAANRWEERDVMLKALESGKTLVVDRYSFSGMAYSLAKRLPGVDQQWCSSPERGLPAPDVVFYMRVSPEASAQRGGYGEERYEKADFQARVASEFDGLRQPNWVVIDASQSIDDIHKQVVQATEQLFASGQLQKPVAKMYEDQACDNSAGDGVVTVALQKEGGADKAGLTGSGPLSSGVPAA